MRSERHGARNAADTALTGIADRHRNARRTVSSAQAGRAAATPCAPWHRRRERTARRAALSAGPLNVGWSPPAQAGRPPRRRWSPPRCCRSALPDQRDRARRTLRRRRARRPDRARGLPRCRGQSRQLPGRPTGDQTDDDPPDESPWVEPHRPAPFAFCAADSHPNSITPSRADPAPLFSGTPLALDVCDSRSRRAGGFAGQHPSTSDGAGRAERAGSDRSSVACSRPLHAPLDTGRFSR